ncbi:MAG: flagellar protein FlaG [Pseudomonadota bacterium]
MLVAPVKNTKNGMAPPAQANLPAEVGMLPKYETAEKPVQEPNPVHLQALAADVQKNLKVMHNVDLQFSVHEASGQTMIIVREESTGEVIREIPPEEILNLAAKFDEMIGLLFDKKA